MNHSGTSRLSVCSRYHPGWGWIDWIHWHDPAVWKKRGGCRAVQRSGAPLCARNGYPVRIYWQASGWSGFEPAARESSSTLGPQSVLAVGDTESLVGLDTSVLAPS